MNVACSPPRTCEQAVTDQYYWGLKVLYDGFPHQPLSVGLYDGARYSTFVTVDPTTFEAYLRGEVDGRALWRAGRWNVWDDWASRWLVGDSRGFGDKDFASKRFVR